MDTGAPDEITDTTSDQDTDAPAEATSLDLDAIEWTEEHVRRRSGALVVASHDRAFLDATVTRIWELRDRRLTTFRGDYSSYHRQREERDVGAGGDPDTRFLAVEAELHGTALLMLRLGDEGDFLEAAAGHDRHPAFAQSRHVFPPLQRQPHAEEAAPQPSRSMGNHGAVSHPSRRAPRGAPQGEASVFVPLPSNSN